MKNERQVIILRKMSIQKKKDTLLLYAIMSPVLIFLLIFSYVPMYGLLIAFQDYTPGSSFFSFDGTVKWVGLKHFIDFIEGEYFFRLIKNTLVLSGLQLALGFCVPIIFAVLLNEVRATGYKKVIQTASYLPHFISTVIVVSMVFVLIAEGGMINQLIRMFGGEPISLNTDPKVFPWVYVITNTWKSFGWNSIIYMAAIAGISPEIYEAARIDGANRWGQVKHITLPSIKGTMFVLLIFAIGGLLNANTEFILLMYSPANYETSDVIGTYIYRMGIKEAKFSETTAISLFMQIINFSLLYATNAVARKREGYSLW